MINDRNEKVTEEKVTFSQKDKMSFDENKVMQFFKSLFEFDKYFLLSFIKYVHIIVQIIVLIIFFVSMAKMGLVYFLLGIFLYPIVFFIVRFNFEFISVLYSINDKLSSIRENTKK